MERVRRLYQLLERRAWTDLTPLLAESITYDMPQSRERVRGRDAYLEFNATYPGDWHLTVDRVADDGAHHAAVWVRATLDGQDLHNVAFLTFDDAGLLTAVVDFWPEATEPLSGRPAGVERY
jgi:ketosteroid isomerase-like protein